MCQVILKTWEGKNGMWICFGIAVFSWPGSYPITTMQWIMCTGKGDAGFRWSLLILTFAILQDFWTGMSFVNLKTLYWLFSYVFIYLLVTHLNTDSNLPGFLVVPYEKYNLISCFLSMFSISFVFWKNIRYGYLHYIWKNKRSFVCVLRFPPTLSFTLVATLNGNQVKVNFGHEYWSLGKTGKYMRAAFNLCQSSF